MMRPSETKHHVRSQTSASKPGRSASASVTPAMQGIAATAMAPEQVLQKPLPSFWETLSELKRPQQRPLEDAITYIQGIHGRVKTLYTQADIGQHVWISAFLDCLDSRFAGWKAVFKRVNSDKHTLTLDQLFIQARIEDDRLRSLEQYDFNININIDANQQDTNPQAQPSGCATLADSHLEQNDMQPAASGPVDSVMEQDDVQPGPSLPIDNQTKQSNVDMTPEERREAQRRQLEAEENMLAINAPMREWGAESDDDND